MTDSPGSFLLRARAAAERGVPAVVITIVRGDGLGSKLLVAGDEVSGSLGSAELDRDGVSLAKTSIATQNSGLQPLDDDHDVFVDVHSLPPLLVLVGAVHVAQAMVPFARSLGFRIAVVDARATLATRERFPDVDDLIVAWPDEAYPQLPINDRTAIVILTHDPKFDEPAILGAINTDAGYIGAVGSRKTIAGRRLRLLEAGATDSEIDRVHGPIGLDIGGKSPEEMSISILAEVLAVRHGRSGGSLKGSAGNIRGASG